MTRYFKGFDHMNTTDDEETVITLTSTEEEPKHLDEITVTQRLSQDTLMILYIEREKIMDNIPIEASPLNENPYVFGVDIDIPVGQTVTLKLKNQTAGSDGGVVGYVKYGITA